MRDIQLNHGGRVMSGDESVCFGNLVEIQSR